MKSWMILEEDEKKGRVSITALYYYRRSNDGSVNLFFDWLKKTSPIIIPGRLEGSHNAFAKLIPLFFVLLPTPQDKVYSKRFVWGLAPWRCYDYAKVAYGRTEGGCQN